MAVIYRQSDRVEIKIDEITVKIKPLSADEKAMIQSTIMEGQSIVSAEREAAQKAGREIDQKKTKEGMVKMAEGSLLAIRYGLKSVSGVVDADNEPYELSFDENGVLTKDCLDEVLNLDFSSKVIQVCAAFITEVPKNFTVEGVQILQVETKKKAK